MILYNSSCKYVVFFLHHKEKPANRPTIRENHKTGPNPAFSGGDGPEKGGDLGRV